MRIHLTDKQMARCREFSEECAKQQQQKEFGQSDTAKRRIKEIARDNLIGKIAEVAFADFIESKYGISIELDFNYYPMQVWGEDDAAINGWKIDIKATKQGGKWMLIEWNKLSFRKAENKLPHLFVMLSVGWDRESDEPAGFADLRGFFPTNRLAVNEKKVEVLRKHTFIPNTQCRLQADNFGVAFDKLYTDWDWLINKIEKTKPFSLAEYQVPFS